MTTPAPDNDNPTPTPADMPGAVPPKADNDQEQQSNGATPDDKQLGPNGEKALAEERKARRAAEKALAERDEALKQYQDRDKTELEKLTERATAAEKALADATRKALRFEIAAEKGVDAELLAGDDEDAMRAHADRLLAWRGEPKPSVPKPDPSQGKRGPVDIDDEIRAAEEKGDVRTAISLKNRKLLAGLQAK